MGVRGVFRCRGTSALSQMCADPVSVSACGVRGSTNRHKPLAARIPERHGRCPPSLRVKSRTELMAGTGAVTGNVEREGRERWRRSSSGEGCPSLPGRPRGIAPGLHGESKRRGREKHTPYEMALIRGLDSTQTPIGHPSCSGRSRTAMLGSPGVDKKHPASRATQCPA